MRRLPEELLKSALNLGSDRSFRSVSGRCCAGVLWPGSKYQPIVPTISKRISKGPMRRMVLS